MPNEPETSVEQTEHGISITVYTEEKKSDGNYGSYTHGVHFKKEFSAENFDLDTAKTEVVQNNSTVLQELKDKHREQLQPQPQS